MYLNLLSSITTSSALELGYTIRDDDVVCPVYHSSLKDFINKVNQSSII